MRHDGTTTGDDPGSGRREPTADCLPSAGLRSHPKRMEGLRRGMARHQEELREMQRKVIIALEKAISRLGTLDQCRQRGVAGKLLGELETALDEIGSLNHDRLPRPEHLMTIADRLRRLNEALPTSCATACGDGPVGTGDDRRTAGAARREPREKLW